MSYGRAASLALGLLLVAAGGFAHAAGKPASEKTTLRPLGSQRKPVSRATSSLGALPSADSPPPPIPPPKASDIRPLYLAQASPYPMMFGVLQPGKREDQFWQLSGGADVIVYLRRDYRSSSTARMVVYLAGGGPALCDSRTDADPFCTIVRPRPGVYEFGIANTSRSRLGSFSLSLSLPIDAPDMGSKSSAKSNLSRPPASFKK